MRFENKICLVTGAGSGIGRATAFQMAREGGKVVVIDVNQSAANETVDWITQEGGLAIAAIVNVARNDQIRQAVALTIQTWSKIDVLVNNIPLQISVSTVLHQVQ